MENLKWNWRLLVAYFVCWFCRSLRLVCARLCENRSVIMSTKEVSSLRNVLLKQESSYDKVDKELWMQRVTNSNAKLFKIPIEMERKWKKFIAAATQHRQLKTNWRSTTISTFTLSFKSLSPFLFQQFFQYVAYWECVFVENKSTSL